MCGNAAGGQPMVTIRAWIGLLPERQLFTAGAPARTRLLSRRATSGPGTCRWYSAPMTSIAKVKGARAATLVADDRAVDR